jgi:hypothetical protein
LNPDVTHIQWKRGARVLLIGHRIEILEQISGSLTSLGVPHGRIDRNILKPATPIARPIFQVSARLAFLA